MYRYDVLHDIWFLYIQGLTSSARSAPLGAAPRGPAERNGPRAASGALYGMIAVPSCIQQLQEDYDVIGYYFHRHSRRYA